ncbi:MAG: hypothetical protein GYB68_02935 [Chloroflexi bacterium]|nr:hypothetical protein [Chloroflexota bacterium]
MSKQTTQTILRLVGGILALLILLVGAGITYIKVTRGSGLPYPDVSTEPLFGDDALEVVAELPLPPANIAVSADERIFFNYHSLGSSGDENGHTVFEWIDGAAVPYPSADFQENFQTTLGMLIDSQNRLWIIDPATLDNDRNTRLFAFDLESDELIYDHTFQTDDADLAQDVQITADGRYVIAASTGLFDFVPANLIIHDTQTGETRTVLAGHESVGTQNWRITGPDGAGVTLLWGLIDWRIGVDGIALTDDDAWLYYGSISHDTLYRVRTTDLLDASLTDDELAARIEAVGQKPMSDGFSMDQEGNVYITDVENGGIARMSPDGVLTTLVKDDRVVWADGISFGPDNMVYFTDSAIPLYLTDTFATIPPEEHAQVAPYYIFRFQNDIPGTPGS